MSEHAWVLENLASYVAGGLPAEERERLKQHAAQCSDCAGALDDVRSVDGQLEELFVGVRPGPALEDRSIQALRQAPVRRRRLRFARGIKAVLAVAAAALLAFVGAGLSVLDLGGSLPFPGSLPEGADGVSSIDWQLPESDRAIKIRASTEGIAGGVASLAGERVDVISTVRRGSDDDSFAQVLLEDVKVLAAKGEKRREKEDGGAMPAAEVTLDLNASDALKVKMASQIGQLALMVRKQGYKATLDTDRVTISQILRAGTTSFQLGYFKPSDALSKQDVAQLERNHVRSTKFGDSSGFSTSDGTITLEKVAHQKETGKPAPKDEGR